MGAGLGAAFNPALSSPSARSRAITAFTFTPWAPSAPPLAHDALVHRLHFHSRLIGLDLSDDVAGLDGVADLLVPLGEIALGHGRRERGHQDLDGHGSFPCSAGPRGLSDRSRLSPRRRRRRFAQCQALEVGGVGQRHVLTADPRHRRVEPVEGACSIICAAISAPMPAKGQPSSTETIRFVFLTDATMVSMSSGRMVRRSITSAEIPSPASASAAPSATSTMRGMRDEGDAVARAHHARLADRHDPVVVYRHRGAVAVEQLVLEDDDGVGIADRRS